MFLINRAQTAAFAAAISLRRNNPRTLRTNPLITRHIANRADIVLAAEEIYKVVAFRRTGITPPKWNTPVARAAYTSLANRVYDYFHGTPNTNNNQANFDTFHESLCNDFLNTLGAGTYGTSQKMVNVLFKYISCYEDHSVYADLFSYCHIPVDNIILCAMNDVYDLNTIPAYSSILNYYGISARARITSYINVNTLQCTARFDDMSWSSFDEPHYKALVEIYRHAMRASAAVPIGSHPWLAFDFHYWGIAPVQAGGTYAFPVIPILDTPPTASIPQFFM